MEPLFGELEVLDSKNIYNSLIGSFMYICQNYLLIDASLLMFLIHAVPEIK